MVRLATVIGCIPVVGTVIGIGRIAINVHTIKAAKAGQNAIAQSTSNCEREIFHGACEVVPIIGPATYGAILGLRKLVQLWKKHTTTVVPPLQPVPLTKPVPVPLTKPVAELTLSEIENFTQAQIVGITPDQLITFNQQQFLALSLEQLRFLTTAQLAQLPNGLTRWYDNHDERLGFIFRLDAAKIGNETTVPISQGWQS